MGRRGQNEGSIHKRKDGRWVAVVNLGYGRGNRRRKYYYGRTRAEVSRKLAAALADTQKGLPIAPDRTKVAGFLPEWLDTVRDTLKPKTIESYAMIVRRHLVPGLGQHPLTKLEPQHIYEYMRGKLEGGLSPRTVQYHHAVQRSALGKALNWGHVARNVATLVDPPRVPRREAKFLPPDQCLALLNVARHERYHSLYVAALGLGLRKGELLALRWKDVDLVGRKVRANATLQYVDGHLQIVGNKSEASSRSIALPMSVVAALGQQRARQSEERLLAGSDWQDWGLVFTSRRGTPLDQSGVSKHFKRMLKAADLPDMRFHDLRHSCASLLLSQKVPPRVVMEILGHSTISLTMNTYSHVIPALQEEAADRMDDILLEAG